MADTYLLVFTRPCFAKSSTEVGPKHLSKKIRDIYYVVSLVVCPLFGQAYDSMWEALSNGSFDASSNELNDAKNHHKTGFLMNSNGGLVVGCWRRYTGFEHFTTKHIFLRCDLETDWYRQGQSI